MMMPGRTYSAGDSYRYGFNGKENDNEVKGEGNSLDFGARVYDSRIGRFLSIDNYANKFPFFSAYSYGGNRPMSALDVKGDSLYILFYTTNTAAVQGEDMFRAAALTRSYDIKHSPTFDPSRDKVVVIGIQNLSDIKNIVAKTVAENSKTYGKTVEFGIWSHAGFDGPVGSVDPSENSLGNMTNQMTLRGWSEINFNWENNGSGCRAMFNGCNTGVDPPGDKASFVTEISALPNFRNVSVEGPSTYSEPSAYVDQLVPSGMKDKKRIFSDKNGVVTFYKTYMVPVHSTKKQWFKDHSTVQPFRRSTNGKGKLEGNQMGDKSQEKHN
jgi:RHS repeat-associated protein